MTETVATETAPVAQPDLATAWAEPAKTSVDAPKIDFNQFSQAAPKELQELFTKNGVKDIDTLAKSYSGLNSLLGKKGLIKPDENAPPEAKAEYQKKLYAEMGVPENGEYEFTLPEGFVEEEGTQDFLNTMAGVAAKSGIGNEGFQNMVNLVMQTYTALKQSGQPDGSELKKQWGNQYESNMNAAKNFYTKVMEGNPFGEQVNQQLGNNPTFIAFAHAMAQKLGEDKLDANSAAKVDVGALQAQAKEAKAKAWDAYSKGDYKGAEQLDKDAQNLYDQAAKFA